MSNLVYAVILSAKSCVGTVRSEYIHCPLQFVLLGTAMTVLCDLAHSGLTGYALLATTAFLAMTPWVWLILVW